MKTQELGRKSGEMLIFGGVYSNLQALEKLHAIAIESNISPENIICTGDIVGYCAQPEESLRFIREWACGCNFDKGTRCDVFSRNWYPIAYQAVSDEMKTWLRDMPAFIRFEYAGNQGLVLHGGLKDVSQFIFKSTEWSVKQQILIETNADFILAGHCGLPFADAL